MATDTFELAGRQFPRVTWYRHKSLRKTYICLMFVVLTSATNGYDGSLMNGLQTLPQWKNYFHNPHGGTLGIMNAIFSIGSLAAIPVVPYIADILGRRMGILIGCLIMDVGVILQSTCHVIGQLIAARFLIGFGVAIAHESSPLLVTELVHPQHRAVFTTIYNTTWYIGSPKQRINNEWSWRIPAIVQFLPSALQIAFIWFVPESPRFHLAKGREAQALKVLADVHANGDQNDQVVQLEFVQIRDTLRLEKEFESNGWSELIRTKGNRHRLLICISAGFFSQWSGNGLVSYYLTDVLDTIGYTNATDQQLINCGLQIFNCIVAIGICFFVDKIGRRPLFLTATAGMLVAYIIWTICSARYAISGSHSAADAVIFAIFLYYFAYDLAWSGLLVGYTAEILPYKIRAKGLTVVFLCVDAALFFNNYANPVALDNIGWKYYIVYCCWIAFELVVVYFFYIETRNTPLEEIAKHFDGEDAVVGGGAATSKGLRLAQEMGLKETVEQTTALDEKVAGSAQVEERIG